MGSAPSCLGWAAGIASSSMSSAMNGGTSRTSWRNRRGARKRQSAKRRRIKRLQPEHQLAEIAAAIKLPQHRREGLEPAFPDVLAEFQLAVAVPAEQRGGRLLVLLGEVEDDEALDPEPHGEHEAQVPGRR